MAGRKGSLIDPDPYPLLHTPGISISGAPLSVSWQDTETQPSPHPQHGLCRVMEHIQYIHEVHVPSWMSQICLVSFPGLRLTTNWNQSCNSGLIPKPPSHAFKVWWESKTGNEAAAIYYRPSPSSVRSMVTLKNMYPFAPLEGPAVSVLHHPVCEKRIRQILSRTRQRFLTL